MVSEARSGRKEEMLTSKALGLKLQKVCVRGSV